MKYLVEGSTVVQQIGEELRHNVLTPAKEAAQQIIAQAQAEAQNIRAQAEREAAALIENARLQVDKGRRTFQSGLKQAAQQAMEALRHSIENELLNPCLHELASKALSDPQTLAKLMEAVIQAIEKEGLSGNLSLILSENLPAEALFAELSPALNQKLRQGKVLKGKFAGGVKLQLNEKGVTVDLSDEALVDLLSVYRDGFREALFAHV